MKRPGLFWLLLIIFLEGYVVLSTELLAIRLLVPFSGSGTDTVSIIIAAVLMPLAFGYAFGGGARGNVRERLSVNLAISAVILTFGLSYVFLNWGFDVFYHQLGLSNRLVLTTIYATLFLVGPVFLLGQTVPLISNYFSRDRLPVVAGRILFVSTMGSFMGAVFCTLVLMAFAGVHNAVNVTIAFIAILAIVLSRRGMRVPAIISCVALVASLLMNNPMILKKLNILSNNQYNTVSVLEDDENGFRILKQNRMYNAIIHQYSQDPAVAHSYFIDESFIAPIQEGPVKDILVLGAGGFTIGRTDTKNKYTYVDIDPALKKIAEDDFLKEELTENKTFVPMEARAFLRQDQNKYDMILMDMFLDPVSTPEFLVTQELFEIVRDHLKEGGVMVGNYWASPTFSDPFSVHLDNTIRSVLKNVNRQIVTPYSVWKQEEDWTNVIYSYVHHADQSDDVYTDDRNTVSYDRPVNILH